jgi:acyl-CoA oxidase
VNRFDALRADTDVFTTFEGDNTILMQLVAKGLLTDYKDSFEDLDQIGLVRFVASTAVETMLERTNARSILERLRDAVPGAAGKADEATDPDLEDGSYHLEMLTWREEHILSSVARRLKRGMDSGREPAEVFSLCQDHVISAAHAHVERIVLEAFLDKIESLDEGPNRDSLKLLCDVYALSTIEQDRGWFLEHGRLSNARAKAVTAKVNELNRRIRPIAQQLVDAFAVPREMLRAELLEFSGS